MVGKNRADFKSKFLQWKSLAKSEKDVTMTNICALVLNLLKSSLIREMAPI